MLARLIRSGPYAGAAVGILGLGWVGLRLAIGTSRGVTAVLVESLLFGCLNALFAVGLVLIYRATRVINFAHAGFGLVAGAFFHELIAFRGWSYYVVLPACVVGAGVLGGLVELLFVRRFLRAPRLVLTVVTIGVGQLLAGFAGVIPDLLGDDDVRGGTVTTPLSRFADEVFPIRFTGDHVALGALTAICMVALGAFFARSRAGIGIRGAAENDDRASLLGIDTGALSTLVWTMAAALSGLAAVLQVPISGWQPTSAAGSVGSGLLLAALAAAVIGAMEDLRATFLASLGLAVVQQIVFYQFQRTSYVDAALLLVILAAFLLQRKRLARTDEAAGSTWAAADEIRPVPAELAKLPVVTRAGRRVLYVGGALVAGYPFVMSPSQTNIASLFLLFGIVVISLVILTGWGGQVSLGQFAFVGVGALVGGSIIDKTSLPFPVALLAGSLSGALLATVLGLTALRVRGLYLAVTTLAFAVAFQSIGFDRRIFGAIIPATVSRPVILFETEDERVFYFVCLAALAFAWWAALGLRNSRTGRVLIAARDNERGVQAFGVNLIRTRLMTFALSGFLAAFAGVLYAAHQHAVTSSAFGPDQSIQIFLTAIIGGLGSVQGALLGALYFAVVGLIVPGTVGRLLASSGGVLLVLLFFPGGLGSLAYQGRDAVLRRIAIRRRIYVPSLLSDRFSADGTLDRVPLGPRLESEEPVPSRYRLRSRIRIAGTSQSGAPLEVRVRRPSLKAVTGGADPLPLGVLFAIAFLDEADKAAQGVLGPEIRDYFGLDLGQISLLVTVSGVATIGLAVPLGFLADRVRRTWMLGIGCLVLGLTSVLSGLAPTILLFAIFRGLAGLNKTLEPVSGSLLADSYPLEVRAGVFSIRQSAIHIARGVGPALAGLVTVLFVWQATFLLLGVPAALLAFYVVLRLREPVRGEQERRALGADEDVALRAARPPSFGEGLRAAWGVRSLRRIMFSLPFLVGSALGFSFLLSIFYDEVFEVGPGTRGLLSAGNEPFAVLGLILGGFVANRLIATRPGAVFAYGGLLAVVSGLSIAAMAASPWLPLAFLCSCVLSFSSTIIGPASQAVLSLVIPARARTLGLSLGAVFIVPGYLFTFVAGSLADQYGVRKGILVLVPVFLVGAAIFASAGASVAADIRSATAAALAAEISREAMSQGKPKLLVCTDLDVGYGPVQVLFNVDFAVEEGEIVALLGTNGAGKSTLLRAVCGLTAPSNGAVFFDGADITFLPAHEHAEHGIVQVPGGKGIFPGLSVGENLRLGAWRLSAADTDRATEEVLGYFPSLRGRMDEIAGNLSGGEQQMLTLSQAFLAKPRLLMIDELSLGLAPTIVEQLLRIVRRIHEDGTTIILVEQSVNVALTVAERAVFMEKGEIRFSGPTEELMRRPDILRSVYLKGSAAGSSTGARRDRMVLDLDVPETVLEVRGLEKRFGGKQVIRGISFDLKAGEILGVIGPNGAGKTTVFDLVSGFVRLDAGTVGLLGEDVTDLSPDVRAQRGLLRSFQDARLFPSLTVAENLAVALDKQLESRSAPMAALHLPAVRRSERRANERVERLVELFGLGSTRDKFVRELSTGQRRIVDMACVLAGEPKVLLLDEPSSGIAQREAEELGPLLLRIQAETGCALLIIEHDMPLLLSVADELLALELGTVLLRGQPQEVLEHPRVVASYLGTDDDVINRSGVGDPSGARSGATA